MGVKHITMRMGTPEYERYSEMLQLCRKGTPDELLAYIQKCCYSSRILNTGHIITTSMAAMVAPSPLTWACIGDNLENVKLLLEIGVKPDIEQYIGGYHLMPAYIYAIGKPQIMKLFFPSQPWWKGTCSDEVHWRFNSRNEYNAGLPDDENYIIWCMMRGVRMERPGFFLDNSFQRLPSLMQEFIVRCGVQKEKLENFRKWLTMRKAAPELLEILRRAEDIPEELQWRPKMEKLLLSAGLFPKEKFFSLLDSIFSPHDLISVLKDCRRNYDASNDKQFLADTMELIFSAILYQCRRW